MKKRILYLLLIAIVFLTGCKRELYNTPTDFIESTQDLLNTRQYAVTPGDYAWYASASRGIVFIPNNGIVSVYNPESGLLDPLCPDPLCSHQPYSGCPYGNCVFTGSLPTEYDGRLYYYIRDQYTDNIDLINEYKIYSTDTTGQKIQCHYPTGNYMYGFTVADGNGFFLEYEQVDEDSYQNLLKSISIRDNSIKTISSEEAVNIDSFLCFHDRIYYTLEDGRLYSCDLQLENIEFEYDIKDMTAVYGRTDLGILIWRLHNKIYALDVETKECRILTEVDDSMEVQHLFVEDEGIYYQVFPAGALSIQNYQEYIECIHGYNQLYLLKPETGEQTVYELPEDFYMMVGTIMVYDKQVIALTYIENDWTKNKGGRPYYTYNLMTGEKTLITEADSN